MIDNGIDTEPRDSDALAAETLPEYQRFLVLFDRLVLDSSKWVEATPASKLNWVPIDNPNVSFGDRVTKVTIKSLFTHLLIAADLWIREAATCREGAIIPVASDPELAQKIGEGDLVEIAAQMHDANMQSLRTFTVAQTNKSICFPGDNTHWTVMGFFWAMYSHHAFHLGNIDLNVRQANVSAPDFFTFESRTMV